MTEDFNKKEENYEEVCFLCRRPESKTGKMFPLPGQICVCSDCMKKTMETFQTVDMGAMFEKWPMGFMSGGNFEGHNTGSKEEKKEEGTEDFREVPLAEEKMPMEENRKEASESEKEENEEKEEDGKQKRPFPNISFINLADFAMDGSMGRKQKIKKRKKNPEPIIDIHKIPAPHKIKEQLDEYVIGQEKAKKVISVAVYNHYKRVATGTMDEIEIEKSNMLMIGPTGSGKTYLVRTLAKLLDVPLAIADATSLTEAGYIGDDIESVLSKLLAAADNDVDRAEQGIVFIDEIDKIAKKKNTHSRDVSGESVQQGLLKLLEGAEVEVPVGAGSKNMMVPMTTMNTRNILFICGGAFPDLDDIIKQRLRKQTSIGFNGELKDKFDKQKDILDRVTIEDLRKFGMIPEFLGRLPIIYTLQGLSKEMLVQILKEPKNAILKQYQKLLALDEVNLIFDDSALSAIADKALEKDTGARALRAIIEEFMLDIMYEIPKDDNIGQVTITGDYIRGTGGPIIDIRSNRAGMEERSQLQEIE